MVDKAKIEQIVADTMAAHAELEGIIVCDADGKVVFGHTISGGVKQKDVASLVVKISGHSSQLVSGLDKGGLKEIDIGAENGFVIVLGDVKLVLAAIAGDAARESMGLIRMALRRALVSMLN